MVNTAYDRAGGAITARRFKLNTVLVVVSTLLSALLLVLTDQQLNADSQWPYAFLWYSLRCVIAIAITAIAVRTIRLVASYKKHGGLVVISIVMLAAVVYVICTTVPWFIDGRMDTYLGQLYYKGVVVGKDYERAFRLFSRGYERNQLLAGVYLGDMYESGRGTEQDIEKAHSIMRVVLDHGYEPYTALRLAFGDYLDENSEHFNPELGESMLTNIVDNKTGPIGAQAQAAALLAVAYETPVGLSVDHDKASHYAEIAASLGGGGNDAADSYTSYILGRAAASNGDNSTAEKHYREALDAGWLPDRVKRHATAELGLAIFNQGRTDEAYDLLKASSEAGDTQSSIYFATLLSTGAFGSEDTELSNQILQDVVAAGDNDGDYVAALAALAENKLYRAKTSNSQEDAYPLLLAALESAHCSGFYEGYVHMLVGECELYGIGVNKDVDAAMSHFQVAYACKDTGLYDQSFLDNIRAISARCIGDCYADESWAKHDYASAADWYKRSIAHKGFPKTLEASRERLAIMYENGNGVERDADKAKAIRDGSVGYAIEGA